MTSIGERIRAARKAKGLSQPAVAREAGCSLATYKRYEAIPDEDPPEGFQYLWRIADLLELNLRGSAAIDDPDNPRLREASELQLVSELHRRLAVRAAAEYESDLALSEAPIEVAGMPIADSHAGTDEAGKG